MWKANYEVDGLKLTYLGKDDWYRDLFLTESKLILVDVDGVLHTTTVDLGEPCDPTKYKTPELEKVDESNS